MMIMMRLFVCICYDYVCGLAAICMCMMMTFVCAKDSCIKSVQIQNKYVEKKSKTNKIRPRSLHRFPNLSKGILNSTNYFFFDAFVKELATVYQRKGSPIVSIPQESLHPP